MLLHRPSAPHTRHFYNTTTLRVTWALLSALQTYSASTSSTYTVSISARAPRPRAGARASYRPARGRTRIVPNCYICISLQL